jgi:saccharopine dehydrogenase-like NADP-dependent oxidoreductase
VLELIRETRPDALLNAVDPVFNVPVSDASFDAGVMYLDMAMTVSEPHTETPFELTGVKLGDYQFERAADWEEKRLLALVGIGIEPGAADVFARHAADELFSEVEEIGVRDAANLVVEGYDFAPTFSIWTTIEECLNPPVVWERDRGWFTTEPFSEPETFDFPERIGPVEMRQRRARGGAARPALGRMAADDLRVRAR